MVYLLFLNSSRTFLTSDTFISTAAAICKDNNIGLLVFSVDNPDNIYNAVCDDTIGTLVGNF